MTRDSPRCGRFDIGSTTAENNCLSRYKGRVGANGQCNRGVLRSAPPPAAEGYEGAKLIIGGVISETSTSPGHGAQADPSGRCSNACGYGDSWPIQVIK